MNVMNTTTRHFGLIVVLLLATPLAVRAEKVLVQRKYTPNAKRYMETETEVKQTITGLPMGTIVVEFSQLLGTWEEVKSTSPEKTELVLTYDRAKHRMVNPMMGTLEFDTDDPDNEEAAPIFQQIAEPMLGMAMKAEFGSSGELISFKGVDAIREKIDARAVANPLWMHFKESMNDDAESRKWIKVPWLLFPNKKVRRGDSWKASSVEDEPRIGKIKTDYEFKVDSIEKRDGHTVVIVSFAGALSLEDAKAEGDAPKPTLEGKTVGHATFDATTGVVLGRTSTIEQNIDAPIGAEMGGDGTKRMQVKVDVKTSQVFMTPAERDAQKVAAKKKAAKRKADEAAREAAASKEE